MTGRNLKNFTQVLDSTSPLTTCLDTVLWLLALDDLKKQFLTNLCYNFQTNKQDITIFNVL